ncbi:transcription factor that binds to CRE motif [Sporothrix stenoceras]|uniref:Transcription factor that binds to CRE motif n=1 Tax=Sporothrix stenoceras TaxID=5173 RepID=A0ABR3YVC4_9PEZI
MDTTWDAVTASTTPQIKVETSPTGSLLSDPSGVYPSLFSGSTVASSAAATPTDTGAASAFLTASSDDMDLSLKSASFQASLSSLAEEGDAISDALLAASDAGVDAESSASPDKKPAKKRKSWGQVLPEPKTNLPPRKRAKTEDEKEQRRVERVLRNRRAAQSSRERKRLEVEALEIRNQELEAQLAKVQRENTILYARLTQVQGKPAVVSTANAPVTLSQELFSSQNGHSFVSESDSALRPFLTPNTIDPVSLSPALHPVPDSSDLISAISDQDKVAKSEPTKPEQHQGKTEQQTSQKQGQPKRSEPAATNSSGSLVASELEPSTDTTHRPAATLCPDLQCLSAEESQVWTVPQAPTPLMAALFYQTTLLLMLSSTVISACSRPMTQIALFLRAGISIPPSPAILTSIIWLITSPSRRSMARNLTSTTSSSLTALTSQPGTISSSATAASTQPGRPSTTLRLKMLRKILTSNPMLARPIKDATMRVLRSVCSEERLDSVLAGGQARSGVSRAVRWSETGITPDGSWLNKATWPSKEALLTLLWAVQVEEERMSMPARTKILKPSLRSRSGLSRAIPKGLGRLGSA